MPIRALASGFDLRFIGYTQPDATYSTHVTPTRYVGAVHTFAHRASIVKGSPIACDALHNGASGPCVATAPNSGTDVRTYGAYDGDGYAAHARLLDGKGLGEAAGIAFDALLRAAMAQGYNDVGRLLATAGIAQVLAHARYGEAMRAVFDAATRGAKAPRKPATPRKARKAVAMPDEGTGAPTGDVASDATE
jgi:hypothetical protein